VRGTVVGVKIAWHDLDDKRPNHAVVFQGWQSDERRRSLADRFSGGRLALPLQHSTTTMLRLSGSQLKNLLRAQKVLLSPLSYASDREWCIESLRAIKGCLGVDISSFAFGTGPNAFIVTEDFDSRLFEVLRFIGAGDGIIETEDETLNLTQLSAYQRNEAVYDARERVEKVTGQPLEDSRVFQEYMKPIGVVDPFTIQVGLPGGAAIVSLGHRDTSRVMVKREEVWLMAHFLTTALEAGSNVLHRLQQSRSGVTQLIDAVGIPMSVFTFDGREITRNGALCRLLARDEQSDLAEQIRLLAVQTGASSTGGRINHPGLRLVRTATREYVLRATHLDVGVFGREPAVMVTTEPVSPELPSAGQLVEGFSLTPREAQVALLLARGDSNRSVAERLGISPATVRTHAEHLFEKLGVRTRKALALKLIESASRLEASFPRGGNRGGSSG
jgi:DNA-binding CsgD family transcriptional regulator